MPGSCEACGGASTARCSRCGAAYFCARACQEASWPSHRGPCGVDSRLLASRATPFALARVAGCLHGGPALAGVPEAALAVAQLLPAIEALRGKPLEQLELVRDFARAQPAQAAAPPLARLLLAAAVDAAAEGDDDAARAAARAAVFSECFAHQGARFLAGLHAETALEDAPASVRRYLAHCEAAAERRGLLRELRARAPRCACFTP